MLKHKLPIEDNNVVINKNTEDSIHVTIGSKTNKRPEHPFGEFATVNLTNNSVLTEIIEDIEITRNCLRILLILIQNIQYDNYVCLPPTKIALKLKISKPEVSKCLKILVEKELLYRAEKIGNTPTFNINHNLIWRGDVKSLTRKMNEDNKHHKLTQLSVV